MTVIFSFGELSLLKKELIIKTRMKESKAAAKFLGCKHTVFLGIPDGRVQTKIDDKRIAAIIETIISKYKPTKIFTHSPDDPMTDHTAVYKIVTNALDKLNHSCDVYTFDVWNPFNFRFRNNPKMYIDITNVFEKKIKALKMFKSQQHVMLQLLPVTKIRARIAGIANNCKYAERFYKIK